MNKSNLLILFAAVFILSCSTPRQFEYFRTGEVTCIANDSRLVTVQSLYTAGTNQQAQIFAERNATENLLFKGVAGCYEKPIVEDETKFRSEHAAFYQWLVQDREYERFITEKTADFTNTGDAVRASMRLTFDMPALRKEMEQRGVIKKFGIY